MLKITLMITALCLSAVLAGADTTFVQGPVSGEWNLYDSPFLVVGALSVPVGATLTINPGVLIRFMGTYQINVSGTIIAEGTAEEPVRFTIDTMLYEERWRGIRIAGGEGIFTFCIIEHASYNIAGEAIASAINCSAGTATITDCIIQYCRSRPPVGAYNGSDIFMERCTVRYNLLSYGCCGGAIGIRGNSFAEIIDCNFYNNTALDGGAIYVNDGSSAIIIGTTIADNRAHAWGGGLFADGSGQVTVKQSFFLDNECGGDGGAVKARSNNLLLERCTFVGNVSYSGAQIHCDDEPTIINSCIFAPFNGEFGIGAALHVQPNTTIRNSTIYTFFTDEDFSGELPDSLGSITTENANGTPCDAFFNIYEDPLFVNPAFDDFNLQEQSPCVDAGDPALEYDPDGTIADMGVLYYDQTTSIDPRSGALPKSPVLNAAYPNPFNPSTTLSFTLDNPARVSLRVLDLLGRAVAVLFDEPLSTGTHSTTWNAVGNPSGIYFAEFMAGDYRTVQKLVLLK